MAQLCQCAIYHAMNGRKLFNHFFTHAEDPNNKHNTGCLRAAMCSLQHTILQNYTEVDVKVKVSLSLP
jgi:hypothetical protein